MVVGDKSRFAVESNLDDTTVDERGHAWRHGQARLWCAGEEVGHWERYTLLGDLALHSASVIERRALRRNAELAALPAEALAALIVEKLYTDRGQSDREVKDDWARLSPHLIGPPLEAFDGWHVVIAESERYARLVWFRSTDPSRASWIDLAPGELEAVMGEFIASYEALPKPLGG